MRHQLAIVLAAFACAGLTGVGPALASVGTGPHAAVTTRGTRAASTTETGLAGYYFRLRKASVHVHGSVTIPASTCGTKMRRYQVQIGAGFTRNGQHQDAIVVLQLNCVSGKQGTGTAQLIAGYHAKMPLKAIRAGQTMRIRVTVTASLANVRLIYPNGRRVRVTAPGGRPTGVDYALTLPNYSPPKYAPIAFRYCSVNRKPLSSYQPSSWRSVIKGTATVDGQVSPLTNGAHSSRFTITYPPPPPPPAAR